jgi:thioredoxin type arsenate reductase
MGGKDMKKRILVLCTGNSARSQMAEGWLRTVAGDQFEVASAGSHPTGRVHPYAIQIMGEIGVDISSHTSKSLNQFIGQSFDYVITVCDNAAEECLIFPGKAVRLHHGFTDPGLVQRDQQLDTFRRVRDELIAWLWDVLAIGDTITFESANADDWPAINTLLEQNHLPLDGLQDHLSTTLLARSGYHVVGSAALELYADGALLRSVAVHPALHGRGLGHRLTNAALDLAKQHNVNEIYLLTETASGFFPRFGFRQIERAVIPNAVKQSVEFTTACPDSALAMSLLLTSVTSA